MARTQLFGLTDTGPRALRNTRRRRLCRGCSRLRKSRGRHAGSRRAPGALDLSQPSRQRVPTGERHGHQLFLRSSWLRREVFGVMAPVLPTSPLTATPRAAHHPTLRSSGFAGRSATWPLRCCRSRPRGRLPPAAHAAADGHM